jgi:hypothetical protein
VEDSWRHSLIGCTVAHSVWALADEEIAKHVSLLDIPSAKQWLFALMETLSRDNFARVAITLWAIWYARRKMIHEEQFQSPLSTHLFIESYLQDLSIVGSSTVQGQKTTKAKQLSKGSPTRRLWRRLPAGKLWHSHKIFISGG